MLIADSIRETWCPGCQGSSFTALRHRPFLSRCNTCKMVFDNPRPTPEAIADYYNQHDKYDDWLRDMETRDTMWRRRLAKMAPFHLRNSSLLDVGAGIGQFLSLAKRSGFSPVYGTEVSRIAIAHAKERFGVNLTHGTLEALDLPQVKNITAFHVLEHVHQPLGFLIRCRDLMKEGGVISIAVPNDLHSVFHRTRLKRLSAINFDGPEIHLSHFTVESLRALVTRAGFKVVYVSLDPYWARDDWRHAALYGSSLLTHWLTRCNLYLTIWLTATCGN